VKKVGIAKLWPLKMKRYFGALLVELGKFGVIGSGGGGIKIGRLVHREGNI